MTIYGKLIDGGLTIAPLNLETENGVIFNYGLEVNDTQLRDDGYKPVTYLTDKSQYVDCDGVFKFEFEEQDSKIVEKAIFQKYTDEEKAALVRDARNKLLNDSDALVSVPDYPLKDGDKEKLIKWRQYLRDLPLDNAFPWVKVLNFEEWRNLN